MLSAARSETEAEGVAKSDITLIELSLAQLNLLMKPSENHPAAEVSSKSRSLASFLCRPCAALRQTIIIKSINHHQCVIHISEKLPSSSTIPSAHRKPESRGNEAQYLKSEAAAAAARKLYGVRERSVLSLVRHLEKHAALRRLRRQLTD